MSNHPSKQPQTVKFIGLVMFKLGYVSSSFSGETEAQEKHVEEYINLLTTALEDEKFFFDYHSIYPVKFQIEMINDLCPNLYPFYANQRN